jgi:hypothetical protein
MDNLTKWVILLVVISTLCHIVITLCKNEWDDVTPRIEQQQDMPNHHFYDLDKRKRVPC